MGIVERKYTTIPYNLEVQFNVMPLVGGCLDTEFTFTATKGSTTVANCEFGYLNEHGRVKIDMRDDVRTQKQSL